MKNIVLKQRDGLKSRQLEGETVVLDLNSQMVHHLNPAASYLWERCDGRTSVSRFIDDFAEYFDIAKDIAERDVLQTITDFQQKGLVDTVSDITGA